MLDGGTTEFRPTTFVATGLVVILLLGGVSVGLLVYCVFSTLVLLTMFLPMALAVVPLLATMARQVAAASGCRLFLDANGMTWVKNGEHRRLDWSRVVRVEPSAMDTAVLTDADGKTFFLGADWFGRSEPLRKALHNAVEAYRARIPVPSEVVVVESAFSRMAVPCYVGMGLSTLLPLAYAVATVPLQFVSKPVVVFTVALIAFCAATMGVATVGAYKNRLIMTPEALIVHRFPRVRTIPLASVKAVRHELRAYPGSRYRWKTILAVPGRSITLTEGQVGYYEAVRLLDACLPTTAERLEVDANGKVLSREAIR